MSTHIRMCIRICLHIPHTGTVCLHMCICVHTQRKRERGRVRGAERDTPIKINAQLISILFLMNFAGSAQIVATPPLNTHSRYTHTDTHCHTTTWRLYYTIRKSGNKHNIFVINLPARRNWNGKVRLKIVEGAGEAHFISNLWEL